MPCQVCSVGAASAAGLPLLQVPTPLPPVWERTNGSHSVLVQQCLAMPPSLTAGTGVGVFKAPGSSTHDSCILMEASESQSLICAGSSKPPKLDRGSISGSGGKDYKLFCWSRVSTPAHESITLTTKLPPTHLSLKSFLVESTSKKKPAGIR
ncbi:hypothetical protein B0H17DRAFT_1126343 [Mycena rosella]|uniref:Uncharacterized protein n=1 Tax=Mycena rosella TaxID=1033263 RepID=A0AAD7GUE8_MYCRO|nr:hypothetical protein B0H17DRAFT_1126343 [Mycena rosella]